MFEVTKVATDMDVDVENETLVIDDGLEDLSKFSLSISFSGITNIGVQYNLQLAKKKVVNHTWPPASEH